MSDTLDRGRRLARRRMAQISFGVLLATFLAVVLQLEESGVE